MAPSLEVSKHGRSSFDHSRATQTMPYSTVLWSCVLIAVGYALGRVSSPGSTPVHEASEKLPIEALTANLDSNRSEGQAASYEDSIRTLVEQVKLHVSVDVKERCLAIIQGRPGFLQHSFSQAGQDWYLFHSFLYGIPYGQGRYLDVGSNHAVQYSNSFFFDRCLGWRGVCVEPNEQYHEQYKTARTCQLVKACVSDKPEERALDAKKGLLGELLPEGFGHGQPVQCRTLHDIVASSGAAGADVISLDVEGMEFAALRCFPFRATGIKTWVVETNKAGAELFGLFRQSGYAHVTDIFEASPHLHSNTSRVGARLDSVFRLAEPPFAIGPDFLPGRKLHGKGPRPPCTVAHLQGGAGACPEQMPVLDEFLFSGRQTCDVPLGAVDTPSGVPDFVLPTSS